MVVVQIYPVSQLIPSNVGFNINTYISVSRCSIISLFNRSGDRNGKSIMKYKVSQVRDGELRLEQVVVVMDHCMQKLQILHGSTQQYIQTSWAFSIPS